jgi:ABC-type lipoprotein export system ATPase subunit
MAAGIGMVHQHFMLVPVFTVAENIMLGHEGGFVLDLERRRARKVRELSRALRHDVDPDALDRGSARRRAAARRDPQGARQRRQATSSSTSPPPC